MIILKSFKDISNSNHVWIILGNRIYIVLLSLKIVNKLPNTAASNDINNFHRCGRLDIILRWDSCYAVNLRQQETQYEETNIAPQYSYRHGTKMVCV